MPRRHYHNTPKGQPFASEWPEWHLECAIDDCFERVLVAALGEAMTLKEAEMRLRKGNTSDESKGWTRRDGFWYCPAHTESR